MTGEYPAPAVTTPTVHAIAVEALAVLASESGRVLLASPTVAATTVLRAVQVPLIESGRVTGAREERAALTEWLAVCAAAGWSLTDVLAALRGDTQNGYSEPSELVGLTDGHQSTDLGSDFSPKPRKRHPSNATNPTEGRQP